PVVATLNALDEDSLVKILSEPRNALIKQYQRIFKWDGVELEVSPAAQRAIAHEAMKRNTGARALRTILEELMLDVMYEVPSMRNVVRVVIDEECITKHIPPKIVDLEESDTLRSA
ncbi:MAG: ATP-dependent Clp protease ATP-binding subunit ClpX, partial [Armatimonadota bacterium]